MNDLIDQILKFDTGTKLIMVAGIVSFIILVIVYISIFIDYLINLLKK
jgi:hypothetical protein